MKRSTRRLVITAASVLAVVCVASQVGVPPASASDPNRQDSHASSVMVSTDADAMQIASEVSASAGWERLFSVNWRR